MEVGKEKESKSALEVKGPEAVTGAAIGHKTHSRPGKNAGVRAQGCMSTNVYLGLVNRDAAKGGVFVLTCGALLQERCHGEERVWGK